MKRLFLLLAVIAISSFILSACSSDSSSDINSSETTDMSILSDNTPHPSDRLLTHVESFEEMPVSFEELIIRSDSAIIGEYVDMTKHDLYTEYRFKVIDCLYGDVTDSEIYIFSNVGSVEITGTDYKYETGEEIYEAGQRYYLILEKHQSIMYDHDRYLVATDLLLNADKDEYMMHSEKISIPDDIDIKDYILSVYDSVPHEIVKKMVPTEYSDPKEEMFAESRYVGQITIEKLFNEKKNRQFQHLRVQSRIIVQRREAQHV